MDDPLLAGAVHDTDSDRSPDTTVGASGVPGLSLGVAVRWLDQSLSPVLLVAATRTR